MDVKDSYRRKAQVFAFVLEEFVAIDLGIAFGWRNLPEWWSLIASDRSYTPPHERHERCCVARTSRDGEMRQVIVP